MAIFGFIRALLDAAWKLRKFRKVSDKLRILSVQSFIPAWQTSMGHGVGVFSLNAPADVDDISKVENRLGCQLAGELKEFYGVCNGFKSTTSDCSSYIVPLRELQYASQYEPSLSNQLEQKWKDLNDVNAPRGLLVISDSFVKIITADEDTVLSFHDVDNMIALHPPEDGKVVLIVVHDMACYPAGTVLEVEGLSATRFENVRTWLASVAATNEMLGSFTKEISN
ncbi:hypothetical protein UNDKW_2120 [Undibacterium sp. KW1]|uniref:SMI1/KNR4 family protein n=1 Tax=Undibacterium sp. KW1 TaxID=2058624 RepID=UPI001331C769|nr:SMI1/KNR4 family protein [Undibacterium sp. KW1]BBB60393.1 hypothetical protein UNDKW_2120 [Undibacterium sp. KW1]